MEVVQFATQDRINLPTRIVEGLRWFERTDGTQELHSLMKFEEPGRISLLSWKECGPAVLKRRQELLDRLGDDAAEEALLLLDERYRKITIQEKARILVALPARVHLFIEEPLHRPLYAVRRPSHLELWSVEYRNRILSIGSSLIDDLP
jgi:hypothetical protein